MNLIPNDWKQLLRTETSQKSLLKTFYYKNKGTNKVKDFQKLFDKEIYFIFQYRSTKYNKPFKFISWPNLLERHHIFSLSYGIKLLLIGLRSYLMGRYFLTPQYIEWETHQIFRVPDEKTF